MDRFPARRRHDLADISKLLRLAVSGKRNALFWICTGVILAVWACGIYDRYVSIKEGGGPAEVRVGVKGALNVI